MEDKKELINRKDLNTKLTNINEFDNMVTNLNNSLNRINTLFHEEQTNINNVFSNPNSWKGRAQTKATEKYSEITNMYPSITKSLKNFISFLNNTSNKYKEFTATTNRNVEDNLESLDVNA